jgi:hypothetical protein
MAGKDLNAILGDGAGGKSFDLPAADSAFGSAPAAFPPPAQSAFTAPPLPSFTPPPPPSFAPPAPFSAAAVQAAASAAPAPSPGFLGLPGSSLSDSDNGWSGFPTADASAAIGGGDGDGPATRVVANEDDADEELHFKRVFDDFVATKKECGESTVGLTLDKFKIKLRGNKTALMSKHQCRTVRFAVYVKDGKAALKATPVRD